MSTVEWEKKIVPKVCFSKECAIKSEYFREAVRGVDLEKQLKKIRKENMLYRNAMNALLLGIKELLTPDNAVLNLLRERLYHVKEVTDIYYFVTNEVINIWIAIKEENFEAEMEIAEILCELTSTFRNLRFDYMVIPKYDMALEEYLPQGIKKILLPSESV